MPGGGRHASSRLKSSTFKMVQRCYACSSGTWLPARGTGTHGLSGLLLLQPRRGRCPNPPGKYAAHHPTRRDTTIGIRAGTQQSERHFDGGNRGAVKSNNALVNRYCGTMIEALPSINTTNGLSPVSGSVGTPVTIKGRNFGGCPGNKHCYLQRYSRHADRLECEEDSSYSTRGRNFR
jgi:hypothetical protein